MRNALRSLVVSAVVGFLAGAGQFEPSPALADDQPALPDAGSIITSYDGGRLAFADLGLRGEWLLSLTPEGAQSTRYLLCATDTTSFSSGSLIHTCQAGPHNYLLTADHGVVIPVNFKTGRNRRYLALFTDDGGIPFVKGQIIE